MVMEIRKAKKGDLKRIDEIYVLGTFDEEKLQNRKLTKNKWKKIMNSHKKQRQSSMKKDLMSKKHYWIVAEDDKEIVGFGQIHIINSSQAELEKLYIEEEFRGRGIASKIEKSLGVWLKKKNISKIYSRILLKNKPSIQFHMKSGFKQTAVRVDKKIK